MWRRFMVNRTLGDQRTEVPEIPVVSTSVPPLVISDNCHEALEQHQIEVLEPSTVSNSCTTARCASTVESEKCEALQNLDSSRVANYTAIDGHPEISRDNVRAVPPLQLLQTDTHAEPMRDFVIPSLIRAEDISVPAIKNANPKDAAVVEEPSRTVPVKLREERDPTSLTSECPLQNSIETASEVVLSVTLGNAGLCINSTCESGVSTAAISDGESKFLASRHPADFLPEQLQGSKESKLHAGKRSSPDVGSDAEELLKETHSGFDLPEESNYREGAIIIMDTLSNSNANRNSSSSSSGFCGTSVEEEERVDCPAAAWKEVAQDEKSEISTAVQEGLIHPRRLPDALEPESPSAMAVKVVPGVLQSCGNESYAYDSSSWNEATTRSASDRTGLPEPLSERTECSAAEHRAGGSTDRSFLPPLDVDPDEASGPAVDPVCAPVVDSSSDPTTSSAAGEATPIQEFGHATSSVLGAPPGSSVNTGCKVSTGVPAGAAPMNSRERDILRLTRFLSFPNQVNERGAEVHLFDGLMSHNWHDIRLLNAGYYGIRLHNLNESAWDSLYLGIGRMKAVVEFEVLPPPRELSETSKLDTMLEQRCNTNAVGGGFSDRPFSAPGASGVLDITDPESHPRKSSETVTRTVGLLHSQVVQLAGVDSELDTVQSSGGPVHPPTADDCNLVVPGTTPPPAASFSLQTGSFSAAGFVESTACHPLQASSSLEDHSTQPSGSLAWAAGHCSPHLGSDVVAPSANYTGSSARPWDHTVGLMATSLTEPLSWEAVAASRLGQPNNGVDGNKHFEASYLPPFSSSSSAVANEDRDEHEPDLLGGDRGRRDCKRQPQELLHRRSLSPLGATQPLPRHRQFAPSEHVCLSQSADRSMCQSGVPCVIDGKDLPCRRRPGPTVLPAARLSGAPGSLGFNFCSAVAGPASNELQDVVEGKGQLVSKAQQEKVMYFIVREPNSVLKLQVYASLTLGMRLRCSYDMLYGGIPRAIPLNAYVPFLRPVSILCLDGGGILGISSLKILERLELEIQKQVGDPSARLVDCFDLIGGTSTGGIISLGLLSGLSIREMIHIWGSMSGRIFDGNRTLFSGIFFEGYDIARLKSALVESFGQRFLNTYLRPYCFVTTTDVKHNPYELYLLRNYNHYHLASNEHKGRSAIPVWAAAWATSAAPTYLKGPNPEELEKMGLIFHPEVQLCDGAMKANNPTMVALEEAARLSGRRLNHFIDNELDVLVSIGTGQPTLKQTIDRTGIVSTFQILANSAHLLTSATTVHRDVLHWLGDNVEKYFRFNVPGIGDIPLDSIDKSSHDIIIKATNDYLSDEKYYDIRRLVRKLASRWRSSEPLANYSSVGPQGHSGVAADTGKDP